MSSGYAPELSPAAKRDLERLPREIQKKIAFEHLPAIQREPLKVGKPLAGVLKNERSYHFGRKPEYRIVNRLPFTVDQLRVTGICWPA